MLWSCVPVVLALSSAYGIIWMWSRKNLGATLPAEKETDRPSYPFNRAHTIKGLVILVVVIGLFFTRLPKEIIVLAAAGIHLASPRFRTDELLKLVEWPILVLFMGLFVVTARFNPRVTATRQCNGWRTAALVSIRHPIWRWRRRRCPI